MTKWFWLSAFIHERKNIEGIPQGSMKIIASLVGAPKVNVAKGGKSFGDNVLRRLCSGNAVVLNAASNAFAFSMSASFFQSIRFASKKLLSAVSKLDAFRGVGHTKCGTKRE
ncbi:hypothetical protein EMIT0P171_90036 [Pseudomonas sp. IT-P171]